jgi:hypothetical protein
MKKLLSLLYVSMLFITVADAQVNRRTNIQDAHDRYNQDTLTLTKAQNKRSGNTVRPAIRTSDNVKKNRYPSPKTKDN